jgi:membrane AbrB-like protein
MLRALPREALTYVLAAAGALVAWALNLPLALLIGPTITISILAQRFPALHVSRPAYALGLGAIGLTLGQFFTPEIVSTWRSIGSALALNTALTLVGTVAGFLFLHRVLRYDAATAVFSGLPGGILTVLEVSKESEADVYAVLFFQVFRIVLGASCFPMAYAIAGFDVPVTGVPDQIQPTPASLRDVALLVLGGVAAAWLGRRMRFPSAEISAPLILSAYLFGSGSVTMTIPLWVPAVGFVIIGASIGTMLPRFGLGKLLRLAAHTGLLFAVFCILTLVAAGIAQTVLGLRFASAVLTFSPASLTEMIALSVALDLDPAMVAANNMFRMIFCSLLAPALLIFVGRRAAVS